MYLCLNYTTSIRTEVALPKLNTHDSRGDSEAGTPSMEWRRAMRHSDVLAGNCQSNFNILGISSSSRNLVPLGSWLEASGGHRTFAAQNVVDTEITPAPVIGNSSTIPVRRSWLSAGVCRQLDRFPKCFSVYIFSFQSARQFSLQKNDCKLRKNLNVRANPALIYHKAIQPEVEVRASTRNVWHRRTAMSSIVIVIINV